MEYDGETGLRHLLKEPCDIVLLDIMLPAMNGMEVLRRIRESSDVPVLMLTAKDDIPDKVKGLDGGAVSPAGGYPNFISIYWDTIPVCIPAFSCVFHFFFNFFSYSSVTLRIFNQKESEVHR